ncbi:gluconokinase [Maribacter sp. PR1]|uniref:Gluconokinase n=1 Tax=Maribacter cobaltidurans TaxID=1178778 RepID=A0ABU7IRY8_9FLAO|nr:MULTISPECIES: gluconokinase [Maribacter]MDC6388326.1 gluconokinase [Maribacter sp. PR1]MEE1975715.1 gluconokinase [Maribacter cobaltidurans]
MSKPSIIYVMGVSGSGKSTVGKLLAENLGWSFFDGDDYHPNANIEKMANGTPLNDLDREDWLKTLNHLAKTYKGQGAVIVCSALKSKYRQQLKDGIENECRFLYLKGTLQQISKRLQARQNHFMPPGLLQSQFETLEEPSNAITLSIAKTPEKIVAQAIKLL